MGLMSRVFGGNKGSLETAGGEIQTNQPSQPTHAIGKDKVLANSQDAISHNNCDFTSIQSAPVLKQPRYFNKAEADALSTLAKEKRQMAQQSQRAYKSLKSIDSSDVTVHQLHRAYQGKVASNELQKLQANAKLAEKLHGQRSQYAQLESRVDSAEQNAASSIQAIKNSYGV